MHGGTTPGVSLLWRVFISNAALLLAAGVVLVVSPVTVSSPIAVREAVVLLCGLTAMLLVDFLLLRRAFAPLAALAAMMRRLDPLRPGRRLPVKSGDADVAALTRAFNEMSERLEAERRESARVALAAQEEERRRLAQELHDEIGQHLTALVLQLDRASKLATPDLAADLRNAREDARRSLEDVRGIVRRVRPEALDDLGLASALESLCTRLSDQTGLMVEASIDPALGDLPPAVELVVFRVAQEALTNVVRHGEAARAELSFARLPPDGVRLRVSDDGSGLSPGQVEGAGMRGMRERALLVDGRLTIDSPPGAGVSVQLDAPLDGA